MQPTELIDKLCEWIPTLPSMADEKELHERVLEKLKGWGAVCEDRVAIQNPGVGKSIPDLRVSSLEPQLLMELKCDGSWKCVSQAGWQLFQASKLLQHQGIATSRLAIFGSPFNDPLLPLMLEALDIRAACAAGSKSGH